MEEIVLSQWGAFGLIVLGLLWYIRQLIKERDREREISIELAKEGVQREIETQVTLSGMLDVLRRLEAK